MIAHLAGVPVEEAVPALSAAGVWVVPARGWVAARLRTARVRGRPGAGTLPP